MGYLDRVLALLAAGTAAVSVVPLFADQWWGFELFSHFRVQYLGAICILLALAMIRRRWRWCLALLPFAAVNVLPLAPYWPASTGTPGGAPDIGIMTVNVGDNNTTYAPLLALIDRESPDLLLLVEFDRRWARAIKPLAEAYPHQILVPKDDNFGIALLSRFPFETERVFELSTTAAVDARVEISGAAIRVLGVHLRPPMARQWALERNAQLKELVALLKSTEEPALLMGDLNVTPFSPFFRELVTEATLRDSLLGRGLSFSWPAAAPILGIPIDHCLVSEEFSVIKRWRGPAIGSDHYPILATLSLGADE